MSHGITLTQGEKFSRRIASTITDINGVTGPFDQTQRTLTLYLWKKWGTADETLILQITTAQDGVPSDPRLVVEVQTGANIGKWRIELGASDTIQLEGMYKIVVESKSDSNPDDVKYVMEPATFYVARRGEVVDIPPSEPEEFVQGDIPPRWLPDVDIMTLGDSISVQASPNNYQEYLYNKLAPVFTNRFNLRFVGSANGVPPTWVEGHPSYRLDSVAAPSLSLTANLSTWLQLSPDVIVVHAGVNDIVSGEWTGSQAATNMTTLLTTIFSLLKGVRVIVCKIIGVTGAFSGFQSAINTFNAALDGVVNGLGSSVSDVMLVDCAAGFDVGTMLQGDGIHPNAAGAQHIANKVFDGIKIAGFGV